MKNVVRLAILAAAFPTSALAQVDEAKMFSDAWYAANYICRGSNNEKETTVACAFRDEVLDGRLRKAGMCYGRKSEPNNNLTWHKCGPGSRKE